MLERKRCQSLKRIQIFKENYDNLYLIKHIIPEKVQRFKKLVKLLVNNNIQGEIDMKYFAAFLKMKDEAKSTEHRQAHLDFVEDMVEKDNLFSYDHYMDSFFCII